jgi:Tol biopolymer transport system component
MKSTKFKILPLLFYIFCSLSGHAQVKGKLNNSKETAKPVMLMNRIGPTTSNLYIANRDGKAEHKLFSDSFLDYHASYSPDGHWIIFTSERNGLGQADIYMVHPDGTGLAQLTDNPALDDQAAMSPDGSKIAFLSTRETHTANIWVLDLRTRKLINLTGQSQIQGDATKPDGFFRPVWSPDGKWIAFSSDRNTEWLGHGNGSGWEHVQELRIYIVHPDGIGLKCISNPGICSGSPKWSPDGKQVIFYEIPVEETWDARRPPLAKKATSQIVSVSIETGKRIEHTSGPGLKLEPQYVFDTTIAYFIKGMPNAGLVYSDGMKVVGNMRSPSWSLDGKSVIYGREDYTPWP